jgi:CBS domain containing-hemolysin-like protein
MTPRTQIQGLPITATVEEAWSVFRASRHSRMPVYEGTIDSIVGVLLLKDLMQVEAGGAPTLEALAKPAFFVPESKNILELLRELQRACTQLALVVDEYGSLSGLVTLEDLLEEVFGEIHDEHEAQAEIQELATGEYLVAGQVHVEDLEARLGLICEREGFDTVAGLVMASLGHVPLEGERVRLEGAILTVLAMEGPRVLTVQVRLTGPAAE